MKAWRIALILWAGVALGFVLIHVARAADPDHCASLAAQVGLIVQTATGDDDLMQAVQAAAEAHCVLLDEPPLTVKVQAPTPASAKTSPKDRWCKSHFASYRPDDGTVLPLGKRKRAPCPFPG